MKYSLEETARRLESPSEAYRTMMDDMLKRLENNEVQFDPIQDIEKKYGL
nr:hypothetical protein [Allomuricauda sp.]